MKQYFAITIAIFFAMLLAGCKSSGSSAPAPTNVNVVAGDTTVTVSWDMQPGVEYWIWYAPGTSITPQTCSAIQGCKTIGDLGSASSPTIISGLTNGTTYSFTINGRTNGGPGGSGSASQSATPRLAGAGWSAGNPPGVQDLHGVAYGRVFVAAGANGSLFSSIDGVAWTALVNPVPGANLNAATYYSGQYLVVGAGGVILRSTDAVTWTQQAIGTTTNDLYAVSNSGTGGFVATGASGTILTSADGINWTVISPVTPNALYGVTYGNGKYVAVGAAGTLLTSTTGAVWQLVSATPSTALDLKGVTYGLPLIAYGYVSQNATIGTFVAIGASGALVTSQDGGVTWTTSTTPVSSTLVNAVTFGHQFIAADDTGSIFTSTDGLAWSQPQNFGSPIYAVTPALLVGGQYDYSAVGASGVNLLAK